MNSVLVFLGAGLGGTARYAISLLLARFTVTGTFPLATFSVNVLGSLLIGLVIGWFSQHGGASPGWKLFLTTGLLGGFTTFSAFSLESAALIERGALMPALLYIAASLLAGVIAVFGGLLVMRLL